MNMDLVNRRTAWQFLPPAHCFLSDAPHGQWHRPPEPAPHRDAIEARPQSAPRASGGGAAITGAALGGHAPREVRKAALGGPMDQAPSPAVANPMPLHGR
jgi:hypothetical protein